jgi:hypothetical protein
MDDLEPKLIVASPVLPFQVVGLENRGGRQRLMVRSWER